MFMSIVSHILSAWFAFLLPSYSTFKALSHLPLSEAELRRWAMYWTIIGAFVAFEYVAEWFVSWLPFYWELKTLFLLFLALPQTQGSTWVYNTYVQPFFARNEADLDAGIVAAQRNTLTFTQSRLSALWEIIWKMFGRTIAAAQLQPDSAQPSGAPAFAAPAVSLDSVTELWRSYGPSVLNAFQPRPPATSAARPSFASTGSSSSYQAKLIPPADRSAPRNPDSGYLPNSYARATDSRTPPPFPEPQLH